MPTKISVAKRVEAQERAIKKAKQKLEDIKLAEAKRLMKIYEKIGLFDVEITDAELENALSDLIKSKTSSSRKR